MRGRRRIVRLLRLGKVARGTGSRGTVQMRSTIDMRNAIHARSAVRARRTSFKILCVERISLIISSGLSSPALEILCFEITSLIRGGLSSFALQSLTLQNLGLGLATGSLESLRRTSHLLAHLSRVLLEALLVLSHSQLVDGRTGTMGPVLALNAHVPGGTAGEALRGRGKSSTAGTRGAGERHRRLGLGLEFLELLHVLLVLPGHLLAKLADLLAHRGHVLAVAVSLLAELSDLAAEVLDGVVLDGNLLDVSAELLDGVAYGDVLDVGEVGFAMILSDACADSGNCNSES
ncbi:hypothetical protein M426DRAFT_137401 [Hypoxylon sp. CI-4A]|nr:hypothetical protein M426DRAFT_137401 [Hypoxylon sp. CI-4A]